MDRVSLLSALDSPCWRRSHFRDDRAQEVRWLPVVDLLGYGYWIGLIDGGDWAIECVDGLGPLTSEDAFDSLLTCLFFPRADIEHKLRAGIETLGLPGALAESFPFVPLVAYALEFSPFYAERALEWIASGPRRNIFLRPLETFLAAGAGEAAEALQRQAERLYAQIRNEP